MAIERWTEDPGFGPRSHIRISFPAGTPEEKATLRYILERASLAAKARANAIPDAERRLEAMATPTNAPYPLLLIRESKEHLAAGRVDAALNIAFAAGALYERMHLQQFEPATKTGRKYRGGGDKGRSRRKAKTADRDAAIRQAYVKMDASGIKKTAIYSDLASQFRMSTKQIERIAKKP